MKYEIVIRRRRRFDSAIAAVGEMTWAEDVKMFAFAYTVPEDSLVNPVVLIQVEVYEDEKEIGKGEYLKFLYRGDGVRFVYPGPRLDGEDSGDAPEPPKPPGIELTFDPNELLAPQTLVIA